jgi:hypothetical protein
MPPNTVASGGANRSPPTVRLFDESRGGSALAAAPRTPRFRAGARSFGTAADGARDIVAHDAARPRLA